MTQEEKNLLLQDLCARVPYGVKILHTGWDYDSDTDFDTVETFIGIDDKFIYTVWDKTGDREKHCLSISNWKPYLRPISSMTDKEMDKLFDILHIDKNGEDEDWIKINDVLGIKFFFRTGKWIENVAEAYDYLNSIYIDYRGLIPMGLALEAQEGMYNIKEK